MSEDLQSRNVARRRRPRGPLIVMNVGNDIDEDISYDPPNTANAPYSYAPPPLPSPSSRSTHSDQFSQPSQTQPPRNPTPLTTNIPEQSPQHPTARSNPSLSSPSGSSSPAVESTPPPSTPGHYAPPAGLVVEDSDVTEKPGGVLLDDRAETQGVSARILSKVRQHLPGALHHRRPSNQQQPVTSPTASTPSSYASPVFLTSGKSPRDSISLMVTADCDTYASLDITGVKDAAVIREMIFSKLQISDEEQPHQSIYRTEVGSFALGESLSDEQLMEICREEGDAKASLKFLVQHSSAPVHSQPPRDQNKNHVPPVLPYQVTFRLPHQQAASPPSNHDSKSSTSEPFVPEGHSAGYEGSVSDDFDRPVLSPSLALSPGRTAHTPTFPPLQIDRGRVCVTPTFPHNSSPKSSHFNDTVTAPAVRGMHSHTGSETTLDREKMLDSLGKQSLFEERDRRMRRKDDSTRQDVLSRKGKRVLRNDLQSKHTQEPWVLVPSANIKERPSTADIVRSPSSIPRPANQHHSSASHSGPFTADLNGRYPSSGSQLYSSSRTQLPQIPHTPRQAPPIPPLGASVQRQQGRAVPPSWPVRYVGNSEHAPLQHAPLQHAPLHHPRSSSTLRSYPKSMDSLNSHYKHPSTLTPGGVIRKPSNLPVTKPSIVSLRELANNQSGSYIPLDSSPYRREPSALNSAGMPRSYDGNRSSPFSPTGHGSSRPMTYISPSQNHVDSTQSQTRLPIQGQTSSSGFHTAGVSSSQGLWPGHDEPCARPQSAFDDIGASPPPPRQYRPLPPSGSRADPEYSPDNDDTRTTRVTSPHHPFVAVNSRPGPSTSSSQFTSVYDSRQGPSSSTSSTSGGYVDIRSDIHGDLVDSVQPSRSPLGPGSPVSPRKAALDNRDGSIPDQGSSDATRSLRPPAHQSPIYGSDQDGTNDTLKADEHAWIGHILDGQAADSTILAAPKSVSGHTDWTSLSTTSSISQSDASFKSHVRSDSPSTECDDDSEGDESGSLWKTPPSRTPIHQPLLAGRPVLSVDIDSGKAPVPQSNSHGSPYNAANFSPQANTTLRKRGQTPVSSKGRSDNAPKRYSSFAKNSTFTWAFRPPAEDVYEQLEEYFPDHDLDKPVIEATSGGTSPTAIEPPVPPLPASTNDKRFRHKKSIRLVAAEHKKRIDRTSRSESSSVASILRKRSTKLWGSKVEEVTPFQLKIGVPPAVPESPQGPTNPKPIFKWVRGELIGKGTYGRVYLALNATTGEMIAVKQVEIPKTDSDRDDSRQVTVVEALKSESETLKDLDHPNIVQYLGFEQTPDFLSIFLEYVPGGSVASCLRKHGKFDDQITRSFTSQILNGLEYLHANGIIHRDVKADNILVDPSGICKISDFGISKRTDDINVNGMFTGMQGSVFWMAPEVVHPGRKGGKHGYNGKVDIWSLGCVVLEMWAGRRPWQDADAIAVIYELVTNQGAPPVPADVVLSAAADEFRRKCFIIKPDDRPSASELRKHPYLSLEPGWTFGGF